MQRSVAFAHTIGVFEGGGVRGAAFAGAYRAATKAGINFVGTVGTSSGSIAAAFIAAGMQPDQVEDQLKIQFQSFLLRPPKGQGFLSAAASLAGNRLSQYSRVIFNLGIHSSEGIADWINETLSRHLQKAHNPVQFSDLPKPLAIVATDLLIRGPKIWSRAKTPDASVGFAVRSSCSIPFFFQPVDGTGSFFVDGGLLANLPIFLVPELQLDRGTPVLAFRLLRERASPPEQPTRVLQLVRAVVDSTVNGVTEVQLNLWGSRQVIYIQTGMVGTTDFDLSGDQINDLVAAGERAVDEFVADEQVRVIAASLPSALSGPGGFREGLLQETSELVSTSTGDVWIIAGDLSWLAELHVTLLAARLAGRKIRILSEAHTSSEYAEALLGAIAIGAEVVELHNQQALRGTIVSPRTEFAGMVAIERSPELHGRLYKSPDDVGILGIVQNAFEAWWKEGQVKASGTQEPVLEPFTADEITEALRVGVKQYRELSITVQSVQLDNLQPLPKFLEAFKLARAEELDRLLVQQGLTPAARVRNSPWAIVPPVIEQLGNGIRIIVDGTHRIYNAIQSGKKEMAVALVENPNPNLPAVPFDDWEHIQILREKRPRSERYTNYNSKEFRPIRAAFKMLAAKTRN